MELNRKVVLITGGSSGIGKSLANAFLKKGAKVIIFGLNKPSYKAEFFKVDISKEEQIKSAISKLSKIDVLINNAGIATLSRLESASNEEFNNMFNVNVKGIFWMYKYSLPKLAENSCIINISSLAGLKSFENYGIYSATKSSVISLTKTMALEASNKKIRANCIAPGIVDTPIWNKMYSKNSKKVLEENEEYTLLKRAGTPEEIAKTAIFICKNDYINGETIVVDGGENIR